MIVLVDFVEDHRPSCGGRRRRSQNGSNARRIHRIEGMATTEALECSATSFFGVEDLS